MDFINTVPLSQPIPSTSGLCIMENLLQSALPLTTSMGVHCYTKLGGLQIVLVMVTRKQQMKNQCRANTIMKTQRPVVPMLRMLLLWRRLILMKIMISLPSDSHIHWKNILICISLVYDLIRSLYLALFIPTEECT